MLRLIIGFLAIGAGQSANPPHPLALLSNAAEDEWQSLVHIYDKNQEIDTQVKLQFPADNMIIEHNRAYFLGRGLEIFDLSHDRPVKIFSDAKAFSDEDHHEYRSMVSVIYEDILYMVIDSRPGFSLSSTDFSDPQNPRPLSMKGNAMSELPKKLIAALEILAMFDSREVRFYDISDRYRIAFLFKVELEEITNLTIHNGIAHAYSQKKIIRINIENPAQPSITSVEPRAAKAEF